MELNFCLDSFGRKSGEDVSASFCHEKGGNQLFEFSKHHNIITGTLCLDSTGGPGVVKLNTCKKDTLSQQWDYDEKNQFIRNRQTSACLTVYETKNSVVITMNCDPENVSQKWVFTSPFLLSQNSK